MRMDEDQDRKERMVRMGRGIFGMLAIGTLPILFMNPLQYLFGLLVCGIIGFGLAWVMV